MCHSWPLSRRVSLNLGTTPVKPNAGTPGGRNTEAAHALGSGPATEDFAYTRTRPTLPIYFGRRNLSHLSHLSSVH